MTVINLNRTKKPVAANESHGGDLPPDQPRTMESMVASNILRIRESTNESDHDRFDQCFLLFRIKETGGWVYTTYDLKGPELVGALECSKMLAFENYFHTEEEG